MKAFTAVLALASAVNAHMILRTPTPAGNPDSSPLNADGSNFPCKIAGGSGALDKSKPNVMTVGSSNTLSFTGSAVHGGGSCQVSLAKGTTITKDTKFMVIHSIEGGCPADVAGNLPADPNGTGASTFQFTVPDHPDLGAGDYTLAWSWNNKIGNREFYMNCAYVQLQGASKKRYAPSTPPISKRQQAPLPDMFVANIGNGCSTAEGIDIKYPNPGSSLEVGADAKLGDPTGSCGSSSGSSSGSGSGSGSSPSPASSSAAAAATTTAGNTVVPVPSATAKVSGKITQSNGGSFATVTGGAVSPSSAVATQAATSAASVAASVPASVATSAAAPVATGTGSGSGTSSSLVSPIPGTSCVNQEGAWACSADGKSFQRCASLQWSVSMAMSSGLTCVPGISTNLSYSSSGGNAKRDLKSHIARRRPHHIIIS